MGWHISPALYFPVAMSSESSQPSPLLPIFDLWFQERPGLRRAAVGLRADDYSPTHHCSIPLVGSHPIVFSSYPYSVY